MAVWTFVCVVRTVLVVTASWVSVEAVTVVLSVRTCVSVDAVEVSVTVITSVSTKVANSVGAAWVSVRVLEGREAISNFVQYACLLRRDCLTQHRG